MPLSNPFNVGNAIAAAMAPNAPLVLVGTSYTTVLADANRLVIMTSTTYNGILIPRNSNVPYLIGTMLTIQQGGIGATTIVSDTGVTVNRNSKYTQVMDGQFSVVSLVKTDVDTWTLFGQTVAQS